MGDDGEIADVVEREGHQVPKTRVSGLIAGSAAPGKRGLQTVKR
jgi:hypothetical protein